MKAIGNHIIIEKCPVKVTKTAGGLELSETQKDDIRYRQGKVISPGALVKCVSIGDLILFDKYAGNCIEIGDEVLTAIQEKDIVVVL